MSIPSLAEGSGSPLADRLDAAEQMVRDYCGWHIAPVVQETLVLDGSGARSLFVPSLRVREIVSCKILGSDVDVDTLEWSGDGFLRKPGSWPSRLRSVELTISHGFDSAPAVGELVREMAARAMSATGGRTRETAGGVTVTNALTAPGVSGGVVLMEHEKATLDRYRIFGRP